MKASRIETIRLRLGVERLVEITIWRVPAPKAPSTHSYKYRLAFVVKGVCVLRYDNESGKGDHRHEGGEETPYSFTTLSQLLKDFWTEVNNRRE